MTDEHRMEQLSRAYVQAVAAVCGCTCARPEPDCGVDLSLRRGRDFYPHGRGLEIQLKSTRLATLTSDHVVYDLDVRAYNLLRRATLTVPALLVLMVLPPNPAEWVEQSEARLELRGCAYWLSLRREPAVSNVSTVRVQIPRQNQFSPAALSLIMKSAQRGEDL